MSIHKVCVEAVGGNIAVQPNCTKADLVDPEKEPSRGETRRTGAYHGVYNISRSVASKGFQVGLLFLISRAGLSSSSSYQVGDEGGPRI